MKGETGMGKKFFFFNYCGVPFMGFNKGKGKGPPSRERDFRHVTEGKGKGKKRERVNLRHG